MQRKIGILMGGSSSEREVSIKTGNAVERACRELGYIVKVLKFKKNYRKFKSQMQNCDFYRIVGLHSKLSLQVSSS